MAERPWPSAPLPCTQVVQLRTKTHEVAALTQRLQQQAQRCGQMWAQLQQSERGVLAVQAKARTARDALSPPSAPSPLAGQGQARAAAAKIEQLESMHEQLMAPLAHVARLVSAGEGSPASARAPPGHASPHRPCPPEPTKPRREEGDGGDGPQDTCPGGGRQGAWRCPAARWGSAPAAPREQTLCAARVPALQELTSRHKRLATEREALQQQLSMGELSCHPPR